MWNYSAVKVLYCLPLLVLVHTQTINSPRMSTKYPGKLYNGLAENAIDIIYSTMEHPRMQRRVSQLRLQKRVVGFELVCSEDDEDPNNDVIKHALCV